MWNNWAGYVLYFKDFIVVTALVGAAFTIWFAVLTRRFSWKKRNRAIYGALLNRSDRELVCVSAILMQWLFVFSAAICGTEVELPHLMFLLLIPLVKLGAGMGMGIENIRRIRLTSRYITQKKADLTVYICMVL
jgi:hypothetical protein